jgi:hypothetical protein
MLEEGLHLRSGFTPKEIVEMLAKEGIEVTLSYVNAVKAAWIPNSKEEAEAYVKKAKGK